MNKLLGILKTMVITLLLLFTALCTIIVFRLDDSVTKIDHEITKELTNSGFAPRPPLVLVSYADGSPIFFQNQNALVQSAADKGFDEIHQFKRSSIDKSFWDQNEHILKQPSGAGFWIWKPYFILRTMQRLPEDSIVFYADGAVVFTKPIGDLLKLLENSDIIFGDDGRILLEQLKKEAYDAFDLVLSPQILSSKVPQADFMIIKNTAGARRFIEKWLQFCTKEEILTDSPLDLKNQSSSFSWHSADQAILGALTALSNENILILSKDELRDEYGVKNFHRKKHREFSSPLWLIAGMPDFLSRAIWNSEPLMWVRKLVSGCH